MNTKRNKNKLGSKYSSNHHHHHHSAAASPSAEKIIPKKLARPRSLSIQLSDESASHPNDIENDVEGEVLVVEKIDEIDENLGGKRHITHSVKIQLKENQHYNDDVDGVVTTPTDHQRSAAGKRTPAANHLTDQGYFDLKFYHNKLW